MRQGCGARRLRRRPHAQYAGVYARFAELVRTRAIDIDATPLQLTADAFLVGERETVEAFDD